jgi:hypothetical protein
MIQFSEMLKKDHKILNDILFQENNVCQKNNEIRIKNCLLNSCDLPINKHSFYVSKLFIRC